MIGVKSTLDVHHGGSVASNRSGCAPSSSLMEPAFVVCGFFVSA
jgi:hypothetical protein